MSFLAPKPDLPQQSDPARQSYDASGPVPVGFGRFRAGLKIFEEPFNHFTTDHGSRRPDRHNYTLICGGIHGPVQRLYRLWVNNKPHWGFFTDRAPGEFFRDIVIPWDRGANGNLHFRIYWGDPNQPVDPLLNGQSRTLPDSRRVIQPPRNPDGSARLHPPYAGLFYIIVYWMPFDFPNDAFGQTSLPPIEAEVLVRPPDDPPVDPWFLSHHGVNPLAAARQLLTDPIYGAELPASLVPASTWSAAALRLRDEGFHHQSGGAVNLSPVWGANRDLAATLADLFGYYDGFLRLRGGALEPDWFPNNSAADPGEVTTLSRHDCIEEADIDPEGWEDTLSEITVTYRNAGDVEGLGEESLTERSTYNRRVTDRGARKNTDAPFLIRPWAARRLAQRELQRQGQPGFRARLRVLRGRAKNPDGSLLLPGDLCKLNYEPYALDLLCRVVEREDRGGEVSLALENERGRFPEDYSPVPDERLRPRVEPPGLITDWRVIELPDALAGRTWPPVAAVVAVRPNASVIAAQCFIARLNAFGGGAEAEVESIGAFAQRAAMAVSMEDDDTEIDFLTEGVAELVFDRSFTQAEQAQGHILALVGDELMSLGELEDAPAPDRRVYNVSRGAFGTIATTHPGSEPVYLFRRESLARMTIDHELLRWQHPYDPANATLWVRLLAANGWEVGAPNNPFSIVLRERLPSELPRPPFTLFVWTRAATQPPTPEGGTYESPEPTTTGWSLIHPEGEDPLWFSQRTYLGDSAPGAWSTPVRVEGRDGEDGAPGQDGQDGAPGQDGQDGAPGQDGKDGEDGAAGQDGASTLMAFGRFLNQPATPTQTVAPPSSSWSLDSENAPGNAIYPLWVTVGTRPVGSALWTWQKPFRFTPLDGEDGAPGQTGLSVAHLTIYRRAASAPNTPIGGTYNFDTKTLSGFTAGWSTTIPDGDNPLWASNATAAVPGPSGVSGTLSWSTPRQISRNGEPALSTVQLFVYKRSTNPTLAEFPSGGSYNFGTKTFTTPTSPLGWSATIPDDAALGFVYVSTALAAAIGNNGTDSALTWTQSRRLTDDMLLADGSVDASKIAPNAVTTAKIAANAVTAVKIAAGAIETDKLAANAVTAAKIAANAITAEKINVATLAAIQTNTGNLVVDGEVRSGSYTAGSVGWKIKSDGSAEFNELTLRKGIITPDDILLHDPSILLYNPNFTVPHGTLPNLAAGWGRWYYDISGSAEWIERGNFGPNYRTDANSPGMPGIGMRFRSFWSDNRWAFIRSANALKIPVLAGERFMARALCKNPGLRILIVFYGADGVWIGNAQIPGQIDTLLSPMYDRQEWGYLEFAFRVPENVRFLTYELHRGRNEDNGYAEGAPNESGASTNLNYACLCGGCLLHRMPGFIHPEALPRPEMPTLSQTFSGSITVARPSIPSGMTLRHTTDGSEVTEMSPVWFNGSLTFSVDTTLRVRFFDAAGFFGPEASANYTRVAEPPPAPLARPVGSFSETNLSLTINSISRPSGGGTTTHVSVNGGTAITSTASPWNPGTVLLNGDWASIWATDGSGNSSPTLTYTKSLLPGDGGYIIP